jgi:hypothetical protein
MGVPIALTTPQPQMASPLITVFIIFGGMLALIILLVLGARFGLWKKAREGIIYKTKAKKALHFLLIHKNKQLSDDVVVYDENNTVEMYGGRYCVDSTYFAYRGSKAYSLYFEGNPNPIIIDWDNFDKKVVVDAETFKNVLNQKLIKDLFVEGKEQLLIIINLVLTGLIFLFMILDKTGMLDKMMKGGK